MPDTLDRARGLKGSANRNRKADRIEEALADLEDAVHLLESELGPVANEPAPPSSAKEIARELADCHGVVGGIRRRQYGLHARRARELYDKALLAKAQGHRDEAQLREQAEVEEQEARIAVKRALDAYQSGLKYEGDSRYGIDDSYNRVNTIVMRLLDDPGAIKREAKTLDEAITLVTAQTAGPRRNQWWAWADLGLCQLLRGDVPAAKRAYDRLKAGAKPTDYESTIEVLQQLLERFSGANPQVTRDLEQGIEHLDRSKSTPRQLCFVAMPFGAKTPPDGKGPLIQFDGIYVFIERAVVATGLECLRADFDPSGGFIVRSMYEALVVAEFVIFDLTYANPNVMYELGMRHGAGRGATLLVCAQSALDRLPFDVRGLRVLPYQIDEGGVLTDGERLRQELEERLRLAAEGALPSDNPLIQVTRLGPGRETEHEKTDLFLRRMNFANDFERRIAEAIADPSNAQATATLAAIEKDLVGERSTEGVEQLHSAYLALFLGYREKGAHARMVQLFDKLPRTLQATPVVREQLALALNRLAEAAHKSRDLIRAKELRARALLELKPLLAKPTSETLGILGRIHKGTFRAELEASTRDPARLPLANAALATAIEVYERGFRSDIRDYYPGVNGLTLRAFRGRAEDHAAIEETLPVIRYAVEVATEPRNPQESYWRQATRLELAVVKRDWSAVDRELEKLLGLEAEAYMRTSTADTLELLTRSPSISETDRAQLEHYRTALLTGLLDSMGSSALSD